MQRSEALIVATTLDDVPISPADCDTDNEWSLYYYVVYFLKQD